VLSTKVNLALARCAFLVGGVSVVGVKLDVNGSAIYRYSQAVLFPDRAGDARAVSAAIVAAEAAALAEAAANAAEEADDDD